MVLPVMTHSYKLCTTLSKGAWPQARVLATADKQSGRDCPLPVFWNILLSTFEHIATVQKVVSLLVAPFTRLDNVRSQSQNLLSP